MKRKSLRSGKGFQVALGNRRSQAAEMVLGPGEAEGGPCDEHRGADQWPFVLSGSGLAHVNRKRHALRAGSLVLIENGDKHEIENTSKSEPLRTLNFYVPPACTKSGKELPRGRS